LREILARRALNVKRQYLRTILVLAALGRSSASREEMV